MKSARHGLRFFGISATCLAVHNILMIATDRIGAPLAGSILISFVAVTLVGYIGHSMVTFDQTLSLKGLGRYGLSMATAVAVAIPVIWFWRVALHLPMIIASPTASVCTVGINFILTQWAIVRPAESRA